jgi:hypothetical protein
MLSQLRLTDFKDEGPFETLQAQEKEKASGIRLRPYQEEAYHAWLQKGMRGVIMAPTGTGKTVIASYAIAIKTSELQSPGGSGRLRLGVGPGQAGALGPSPCDPPGPKPVEAEGGSRGERRETPGSPDLPGACSRATGREISGRGCSRPKDTGTVCEADKVRPRPVRRGVPRLSERGRGEEAMSQSKKPETEGRGNKGKTINEELEFLIEMEDKMPRKDEKKPVDYDLEQLVEETVDNAMAELRRALPQEELEIYERCYRFFKRTNSRVIRDYTAEQILRRSLILRG